jgi:PLP dependent protein
MNIEEYEALKNDISGRLAEVERQIAEVLSACGRTRESVTLIGVSKFFPPEYAKAAFELGLADLGENRVQELLSKKELLAAEGLYPNWHLIGTLQTNKVKNIVGSTELIHSVSSIELIEEVQKRSMMKDLTVKILLQINTAREESKHGFYVEEIEHAVELASSCPNLVLCGLMTMAPIQSEEHEAVRVFEETRVIFENLKKQVKDPQIWNILSMGMSQDYIDAIECGATHIRIGTAIFGHRS